MWAKEKDTTWTCTHCRGVCPRRARCHQYQRNNQRRRLRKGVGKRKRGREKGIRERALETLAVKGKRESETKDGRELQQIGDGNGKDMHAEWESVEKELLRMTHIADSRHSCNEVKLDMFADDVSPTGVPELDMFGMDILDLLPLPNINPHGPDL